MNIFLIGGQKTVTKHPKFGQNFEKNTKIRFFLRNILVVNHKSLENLKISKISDRRKRVLREGEPKNHNLEGYIYHYERKRVLLEV